MRSKILGTSGRSAAMTLSCNKTGIGHGREPTTIAVGTRVRLASTGGVGIVIDTG
jgi:hypothetical protein